MLERVIHIEQLVRKSTKIYCRHNEPQNIYV